MEAIEASITDAIALEKLLDGMSKDEMIKYADDVFGLTVDPKLSKDTIKSSLLKADQIRHGEAKTLNDQSTRMFADKGDKIISVKFHRLDFADADLEFSYSGKIGMRGKVNKNGFQKCPSFHLYPGETYALPRQVIEHLKSLSFVTHKTVMDQATGMIKGTIPIVKPKFILEYVLSNDQLERLAN